MTITLKDIVSSGLISAPVELRSMSNSITAKAILTADGCIQISDSSYDDIDIAMQEALKHVSQLSSQSAINSGWRFWGWFCVKRGAWTPLEHLRAQCISLQKSRDIRTSDTHPLRIDQLEIPDCNGVLGLTFCPGKITSSIYGGDWARDLKKDFEIIDKWGAAIVVTLLEQEEFTTLKVPEFSNLIKNYLFEWIHLPIQDMSIPDQKFESSWMKVRARIHSVLNSGGRIVVHCRGGIGRTGLLAARILIEFGVDPINAIEQVRDARENSIETYAQEEYILNKMWN